MSARHGVRMVSDRSKGRRTTPWLWASPGTGQALALGKPWHWASPGTGHALLRAGQHVVRPSRGKRERVAVSDGPEAYGM